MTQVRANYVRTLPIRRAQRLPQSCPAWELAQRIEDEAHARWVRWAGHYGALSGPWLPPVLRPPKRRLELLIRVVLAATLAEIGEETGNAWTVDLRMTENGEPLRMVVRHNGSVSLTPISMGPSSIRIDGKMIGLKSKQCGTRILTRLIDAICAGLGAPMRAA